MKPPLSDELEQTPIAFLALAGAPSVTTLRFTSTVNGHPVHVLLDSGNTHSFIQTRVAKYLQLPIQASPKFSIVASNRATLYTKG